MTLDKNIERLERLADAFEAAVLEADDAEVLETGTGEEAAAIVARALGSRNCTASGQRRTTPRVRARRVPSRAPVRQTAHDLTLVRARFSSDTDDFDLDEPRPDGSGDLD